MLGKTKPNYAYLSRKIGIKTQKDLKKKLLAQTKAVDLKVLAKDVEKFLFDPKDSKRIALFDKFIRQKL